MKTIKKNFITICLILLPVYLFGQTTVKKVQVEKPTNTVTKPGSSSARIKEIANQILVKTENVYQIQSTSAICSFVVEGNSILEKGVCLSTGPNPTVYSTKFVNKVNLTNLTVNLTGLKSNVTYYVRAYAKNNAAITYGNELNFTTTAPGSDTNTEHKTKPTKTKGKDSYN
jgi:hypothetical protein